MTTVSLPLSLPFLISVSTVLVLYWSLALSVITLEQKISLDLIIATTSYLSSNNKRRQTCLTKFGGPESWKSVIHLSYHTKVIHVLIKGFQGWVCYGSKKVYCSCKIVFRHLCICLKTKDNRYNKETVCRVVTKSYYLRGSICKGLIHYTISRHIKILIHWLFDGV